MGARYLRDNIKYSLGAQERAGLELFYPIRRRGRRRSAGGALRFF